MIKKSAFSLLVLALSCFQAEAATYIHLISEAGDYIGGGIERTMTTTDGTFSVSRNYDNGISVSFNGSEWWDLDFAAPGNAALAAAPYENAERFPFQSPTKPGLDISGSGRGCNTLTGRFDVLEVKYSADGLVESFAADFEQHCEGFVPALLGSIRYNSNIGAEPQLNVTANGSRDPIILQAGQRLALAGTVEAAEGAGKNAEVWFGLQGPYGNQWHNGLKFAKSSTPKPYFVGPLQDVTRNISKTMTKPGVYVGVIAVDMDVNGVMDATYTDYVVITVK